MSTPLTATSDAMDEVVARARILRLEALLELRSADRMASSAEVCLIDAGSCLERGRFDAAADRALRGLRYLVGFAADRSR